jgi:hypothetical protein
MQYEDILPRCCGNGGIDRAMEKREGLWLHVTVIPRVISVYIPPHNAVKT